MDWSARRHLPCPLLWPGGLKLLLPVCAKSDSPPGLPARSGQAQLPTQEPSEEPACGGGGGVDELYRGEGSFPRGHWVQDRNVAKSLLSRRLILIFQP